MGSPISSILADIFMDNLENKLLNSGNKLQKSVLYWYRYVDDIIVLWNGSDRQLDFFKNLINKIHQNILFTSELDLDKCINYLDGSISLKDGKHNFRVFRKPSYTDRAIAFDSMHSFFHKLTPFHSLIHRLVTLPLSKEDYHKEIDIIKQISVSNGYTQGLIDKLLVKKQGKLAVSLLYSPVSEPTNKKQWVCVPSMGECSQKLTKLLAENVIV
jgi:hypothetical protein